MNIPMGALRPGAGHPVRRREETADAEEVRTHTHTHRYSVCLFVAMFTRMSGPQAAVDQSSSEAQTPEEKKKAPPSSVKLPVVHPSELQNVKSELRWVTKD